MGAAIVGLGFNTKTLQAFLVLPAFYLLYLLAARATWLQRFMHLAAATVVLLVVSLSWAVAVDLTPPDQRPYVGGSEGARPSTLHSATTGSNVCSGEARGREAGREGTAERAPGKPPKNRPTPRE